MSLAVGIVEATLTSSPVAVKDGERTVLEFRRILNIEVRRILRRPPRPAARRTLRPKISGCSVRTNTPTRHSGNPASTRRSQASAIISVGLVDDLARRSASR